MSYSMSPPPQKPAPRPYSPHQNSAGSPVNAGSYGPPPAKRQRTSPDPRSPPNGTSGWTHPPYGQPGPVGYSNPYAPPNAAVQSPYYSPTYSQSPQQSSFNTPQPYYQYSSWQAQMPPPPQTQSRQISPPSQQSRDMPPPPRPNREDREEKVGVDEIGDSLFGSGINLKDEENYLHAMYSNRHHQYFPQDSQSFSTNQNTSFGSSTMSPNNSFNHLTQGTSFGSQEAVAGTMGAIRTEEDIEVEQRRKREAASREQAERRQHHLNNQFLQCNSVRKRMDRLAKEQGVMLNMHGVWIRTPDAQPQTSVMVNGTGKEGVVATKEDKKAESVVYQNAPFEQLVSLISLAAGERLRGLMDEAHTLARARKYGDHGRVPPEFADIVEGEGQRIQEDVVPESITGTQWDRVPEQDASSPKDADMADGVENAKSKSSTPQPQATISFQGVLNAQLRNLAERDQLAEKERVKRRESRKRKASEISNMGDTPPADAVAAEASVAPIELPKLTKKEQMRQQKEKNSTTEAQLHHTTNQTAAMMAMGKKGSKYSWMTGGIANVPTNKFARPTASASASGTATPTKAEAGSAGATPVIGGTAMTKTGSAQGNEVKIPEWGDWRETGKGVEMRDWILVLDRDGREKLVLTKAMIQLGR